jgi:hypothetical protein
MKQLICGLLFVPVIASAEFLSGNDLLSDLQSGEAMKRAFAMGYIAGVADANQSVRYCPPGGIRLSQLRDMTEQYLIANASFRNLSADVLVGDMLNLRWPCEKVKERGRGA